MPRFLFIPTIIANRADAIYGCSRKVTARNMSARGNARRFLVEVVVTNGGGAGEDFAPARIDR
ncbi:MAG: hypothetical protein AAF222_14080, partial [Pseudomonadota bacterium]